MRVERAGAPMPLCPRGACGAAVMTRSATKSLRLRASARSFGTVRAEHPRRHRARATNSLRCAVRNTPALPSARHGLCLARERPAVPEAPPGTLHSRARTPVLGAGAMQNASVVDECFTNCIKERRCPTSACIHVGMPRTMSRATGALCPREHAAVCCCPDTGQRSAVREEHRANKLQCADLSASLCA